MEKEKKKVNSGLNYKNGKYRPNVMIEKCYQNDIESHFKGKGFKTANEYIKSLMSDDIGIDLNEKLSND